MAKSKTTCMGYPVSEYKKAEKLYNMTTQHDKRKFWQLTGWERELWVRAMREMEQMIKARKTELPYESDEMRKERLASPSYVVSPDIDFLPRVSLFSENDSILVVRMPSYTLFYERWTVKGKQAFKRKYGTTKVKKICEVMPTRMKAIGDGLGLQMESFEWREGIAVTKYTTKPPAHLRVQLYNPIGKTWTLVDVQNAKIIGHKGKMYKNIPLSISIAHMYHKYGRRKT